MQRSARDAPHAVGRVRYGFQRRRAHFHRIFVRGNVFVRFARGDALIQHRLEFTIARGRGKLDETTNHSTRRARVSGFEVFRAPESKRGASVPIFDERENDEVTRQTSALTRVGGEERGRVSKNFTRRGVGGAILRDWIPLCTAFTAPATNAKRASLSLLASNSLIPRLNSFSGLMTSLSGSEICASSS